MKSLANDLEDAGIQDPEFRSQKTSHDGSRIALAMLPITPVPFTGNGAIYAWARLVLYGSAAVVLHAKHKNASYVMAGAAGLSLVSSLAAKSWEG